MCQNSLLQAQNLTLLELLRLLPMVVTLRHPRPADLYLLSVCWSCFIVLPFLDTTPATNASKPVSGTDAKSFQFPANFYSSAVVSRPASASVWWPVPPLKPEEDEFKEWTMKPMGRRSDPASVRNEPLPPKNSHIPCIDLYWPTPKWGYIAHCAHTRLHWQGLRISNPCICGIFRRNTGLTGFSASLFENGKV